MMQELNYIRCGDYYIPDIRLPEENRPIGRWGRMHRDYIKDHTTDHRDYSFWSDYLPIWRKLRRHTKSFR